MSNEIIILFIEKINIFDANELSFTRDSHLGSYRIA